MSMTAWLDQRAAGIRDNREGPAPRGVTLTAETLAAKFPDLDRKTIGAVLIAYGALMADAWTQLKSRGCTPAEILEGVCALTDMAGEHLYAPEDGAA